jgi:hypothetical protein
MIGEALRRPFRSWSKTMAPRLEFNHIIDHGFKLAGKRL